MRNHVLHLIVLLFCAVAVASAAPRNVVLFVTDDQSPDFGAYGNTVMKTPNMDRLAVDGTLFRRHLWSIVPVPAGDLPAEPDRGFGHKGAYSVPLRIPVVRLGRAVMTSAS